MIKLHQSVFFGAIALVLSTGLARADLNDGSCTDAQKVQSTTTHTTTIAGKSIDYTATAGFIEVTATDGNSKACIFYTSYVVQGSSSTPRPITFAFNGGPGSASLWLHMGLLGPKRVDMGTDGLEPPQGLGLITNDSSPLDVTDIVLIDPVATGFSHTEGGVTNDPFFGVNNDYASIGAFVQNYLITYNRWTSPKYILGESYGGIRGSLLTSYLQSMGIGVSGLILISPALSPTTFFWSTPDNTIPYWTNFPSFATTAWYHQKIDANYQTMDVASVYNEAKQFADTALRSALDSGNSDTNRDAVTAQISAFTGFSSEYIQDQGLKITDSNLFVDLMAPQGLNIGRYDSRFVAPKLTGVTGRGSYSDPSSDFLTYPFSTAINEYLRDELNVHLPVPYIDAANAGNWPSDSSSGSFPDVMPTLAGALSTNPNLHVMIASGYFDLACPMGTVEYEISQMPGGPELASRVHQNKYVGGHMMYINPAALRELKADIVSFIQGS